MRISADNLTPTKGAQMNKLTLLTAEDCGIIVRRLSFGKLGHSIIASIESADRKDAALMRSAQRYNYARAICQFGGTEADAIQVR